MPFNVNKYHILQVGTRNQKYEYEISGVKLESVQCVKDLGVTIASNLKFSLHCTEANANGELPKRHDPPDVSTGGRPSELFPENISLLP